MLFADGDNPNMNAVLIAAIGFLTVVANLIGGWLVMRSQMRRNMNDRDQKNAAQTETITNAVTNAAGPLAAQLTKVEKNTNGMGERAEKSAAIAAEAVTTLEVTTEKLKRYDPDATVIKKADEVIAKQKQSGDSQAMPAIRPNG